MKTRVRIVVEVNLDQVVGMFSEGEDFVKVIKRTIPHFYDPKVELVEERRIKYPWYNTKHG